MARTESNYKLSLYFCNVKIQLRHDVAAISSVFRAFNFLGLIYSPNECGSSNARKGLAVEHLDSSYWGFFYLSKLW